MASSFTIRLPWPPSVNDYWQNAVVLPRSWAPAIQRILPAVIWRKVARRFIGKGDWPLVWTFIGERGKKFRIEVESRVFESLGGIPEPDPRRMKVTFTPTSPTRRVYDLSNLLKAAEDALTHANVWVDDSQIDDLRVHRGGVEAPGWIDVTIEVIPPVVIKPAEEQKQLFQE